MKDTSLKLLPFAGAGLLMFSAACSKAQQPEKRPNIIFIMADDHANRAISAYDGTINQTPNIDRLAKEGAIFTNSFCGNSICGPSRASILTGKHSHKNGVVGNAAAWNNQQTLFPRELKKSGYTTALIGKWHLNSLPGDEFHYSKVLTGAGNQGFYYNPDFCINGKDTVSTKGFSTDIITDESLQWLNEHKDSKNPFMLFVQFKAAHVPRMPHFRYLDKYKNDSIPEPATLHDDYQSRQRYAREANMKMHYRRLPLLEDHDPTKNIYFDRMTKDEFEKWHSYKDPETRKYLELVHKGLLNEEQKKSYAYQQFVKDYIRVVDGIDENVGRILNWLDKNKQLNENTIVVYASDQSYFTGEHGWAEKRFMYEEGMKMPLLIRWPGHIKPATRVKSLVQNIDYGPSFLDCAGVKIPSDMQGESFKSIMEGESTKQWRKSIYYHYYDHGKHNVPRHQGVRTDRYKLINFYTEDKWEFYDLKKDSGEINNLYENPRYSKIIEELKKELNRLKTDYEVPEIYFKAPTFGKV